jgi:hypothetical protein
MIQVRVFLEDNATTLTTAEQKMIHSAIAVVEQTLEWNVAYMAEVHNFFVQNKVQ